MQSSDPYHQKQLNSKETNEHISYASHKRNNSKRNVRITKPTSDNISIKWPLTPINYDSSVVNSKYVSR